MLNFTYHNPVNIVFGNGSIAELPKLVPADAKILLTYGGGSIKRNGVYDQVVARDARAGRCSSSAASSRTRATKRA